MQSDAELVLACTTQAGGVAKCQQEICGQNIGVGLVLHCGELRQIKTGNKHQTHTYYGSILLHVSIGTLVLEWNNRILSGNSNK